jgi:hypothetical protein
MNQCYDCTYRETVPGSVHSACGHPATERLKANPMVALAGTLGKRGGPELLALAEKQGVGVQRAADALNIRAHFHGIKNGWFVWPVNFDPTWLENCDGFTASERGQP